MPEKLEKTYVKAPHRLNAITQHDTIFWFSKSEQNHQCKEIFLRYAGKLA